MLEFDKIMYGMNYDCGDLRFVFIELYYSNFIGLSARNEGIAHTFEDM